MDCVKCGSPMYHPSPNELCPDCEGKRLDEVIAKDEATKQKTHPMPKTQATSKTIASEYA